PSLGIVVLAGGGSCWGGRVVLQQSSTAHNIQIGILLHHSFIHFYGRRFLKFVHVHTVWQKIFGTYKEIHSRVEFKIGKAQKLYGLLFIREHIFFGVGVDAWLYHHNVGIFALFFVIRIA